MPESLLEDDFKPHFDSWKEKPTPENASTLLKQVDPVLTSALRTYVGPTHSQAMRSRAKLMALKAMEGYDPSKAKLKTHLMFQLQGLRRHAAQEFNILHMPEQVGLDKYHMEQSENELRDSLGRDPSTLELADHVGMSPRRIRYIRQYRPAYAQGSLQRESSEGEDIWAPAVQGARDPKAWLQLVYHDLHPVDQVIMEHTLGMGGKPVLQNQEIAKRLRLSPGAISQRKAKIQQKINMRERYGVL
jgi:DNA-directed RNA polymerase specialized sigma subunit